MAIAAAPAPQEPVLDLTEIQGNILAGFNKDFQSFLFIRINDRAAAKAWLRWLAPRIATCDEVLAFNRLFRALRGRRGEDPAGIIATWTNVAFTHRGIASLTSLAEANTFTDQAFCTGMAGRAEFLGDPIDASGSPTNWLVGSGDNIPDALVIVAGDDALQTRAEVNTIRQKLVEFSGRSGKPKLQIIHEDHGQTIEGMRGHEHFGFKDGISQPGIRGRATPAEGDFLTPRWIDSADERSRYFGKPGQPLVWPGQFVVGYARQDRNDELKPLQDDVPPSPNWAANGSYLVYRRLRQNVSLFWDFMRKQAKDLKAEAAFADMDASRLAALLMGRWQSGAPVMRAHDEDPQLGADDLASNHFSYGVDTPSITLQPQAGYGQIPIPAIAGDANGMRCPFAAHIRKVNPRDQTTEIGGGRATLTKLVLRRGIPYGAGAADRFKDDGVDRGLLFLCYQSSIENQFEFLQHDWANQPSKPRDGAGHDPVIGQNSDAQRVRDLNLNSAAGSRPIHLQKEWVLTTGGAYLFAPSINAITTVLSI